MGDLIINGKIIEPNAQAIVDRLKNEANWGVFKQVITRGENLAVTCPFHKDGEEHHPSCYIYANADDSDKVFGTVHCFTCGTKTSMVGLVSHVLSLDIDSAKDWLIDNFGSLSAEKRIEIPDFDLKQQKHNYLDDSILENYNKKHPYMYKRKLTDEVIDKFKIGFDDSTDSLVFPVWDDKGRLEFLTRRSVKSKFFRIPQGVDKPVYLLNFLKKENQTTAYVCESQLNALTLQSWGYPAVALFGTGTEDQYNILAKSGIRIFNLCFDGDDAGDKGIKRFTKYFNDKPVFINTIKIPRGKDINDLTLEEFKCLKIV